MHKNLKILVIGVGSNVSVGILKAIRSSFIKDITVYGACIGPYAAGYSFCDKAMLCPKASDPSFMRWLECAEAELEIDIVMSGVEEVLEVLSRHSARKKTPKYLVSDLFYLKTFNDKWLTANWFKKNGVPHPATVDLLEKNKFDDICNAVGLPFIIKPKQGKGSKEVKIIETKEEYDGVSAKHSFVAQELVGNEDLEYTCGIYKSAYNYVEVIVMRRTLKNGSTSIAEVIFDKEIEEYCRLISSLIDTVGSFNIQLRICPVRKVPMCFEINMRQSGTTAIRHNFGFRDCEAWVSEEFFGKCHQHIFDVKPGIAIRFEQEAYFAKDDLQNLKMSEALSIQRYI